MTKRCLWVPAGNELYEKYHDEEWGVPVHDDRKHFEFLILEGAQAGLSWLTVLKRRQEYKKAFANFDPIIVSQYSDLEIENIIHSSGVIRNRLKVRSAVNNAKKFIEIQQEFTSFDSYIWRFVNFKTIHHHFKTLAEYPTTSPEAEALSRDLKQRGFSFVGPTVMYAHLQACGLINDHMDQCFRSIDTA